MRAQWLSILVLGLAFTASACGSDPAEGGGDLGNGGTAGAGATGGTGGTGGSSAAGTAGTASAGTAGSDAKPPVTDACIQTEEMKAAAEAEYTDEDGNTDTPGGFAATCGRACLPEIDPNSDAFSKCVSKCIGDKTGNALSDECASCLVIPVECAVLNCFSSCAQDTPDCDPCLCRLNNEQTESCIDEYTRCSGLESSTCDGL